MEKQNHVPIHRFIHIPFGQRSMFIVAGNIAKINTDAIVCPMDLKFEKYREPGARGRKVSNSIHSITGDSFFEKSRLLAEEHVPAGQIKPKKGVIYGSSLFVPTEGALPSKYVAFVFYPDITGIDFHDSNSAPAILHATKGMDISFAKTLDNADKLGLEMLAMPVLGKSWFRSNGETTDNYAIMKMVELRSERFGRMLSICADFLEYGAKSVKSIYLVANEIFFTACTAYFLARTPEYDK